VFLCQSLLLHLTFIGRRAVSVRATPRTIWKQDFPVKFDLGFYFQQVHKLSAHILLRRHWRMCCPYFASPAAFNLAGRRNLPTFENVLTQPRTTRR
jgi:hypothetical protein